MKAKRLNQISLILCTLLLSSCSTFSFIFERLDWFTVWRLDSMFDLSSEQKEQVQPDLVALQTWMRKEGFPHIITKLEGVIHRWENNEAEEAYLYLISAMQEINRLHLNAMRQGIIRFSLTLNERNAVHYRSYTEDKQDDWFSATKSLEARIEDEVERLEEWFGHLHDQQVILIERHASLQANERQIRIENLASWRDGYLNAALNRDVALLNAWLDDLSLFWTADYIQLKQHNEQQRQALVFALFPTLTDKQKRHAREHVENWIEQLQDVL